MYKSPKLYMKKMVKRRRRLRSLVRKENTDSNPKLSFQAPVYLTLLVLAMITAAGFYTNIDTSQAWRNFMTSYRNQYELIVHSEKDYCSPSLDAGKLISEIQEVVLNQQTALASIELALKNDSKFTAIGIVGSTGVGKSLFGNALKENFPWQENIQTYSWTQSLSRNQKTEDVLTLLNYLSACGRNLLIIDNMGLGDLDFLHGFNRYTAKHVEQANVNLVVVYIFNVVTFTEEQREQYEDTIKSFNQLENVKLVNFRKFNINDLKDCIKHEARSLNLTLDENLVSEVSNMIDVEGSGCKTVYSKLMVLAGRRVEL